MSSQQQNFGEDSDITSSQKKVDSIDIIIDEDDADSYGVKTKIALPNRVVHTFTPNSLLMNETLTKLNYSNAMFKKLINTDDLTLGKKYKISALRCVDVKKFSNRSVIIEIDNDREFFLPSRYSKVIIEMFYDNDRLALSDHTILVDNFFMIYKGDAYYADKKTPHLIFQYYDEEEDEDEDDN